MGALFTIPRIDYLLSSNILHFLFCIFMVVYMRFALENQNNSHSRHVFKHFMMFVVYYLVADMASYVFDNRTFFSAKFFNHASMFAAISLTTYIGYLWNNFFDVVFNIQDNKRARKIIYLLPVLLSIVCLFINLFTGWFFSMGEENIYSRGSYAFVSFFLQYVSFGVLAVRAMYHKFPVKTIRYLKLRNSFIWLGLFTLVFGILQDESLTNGVLSEKAKAIFSELNRSRVLTVVRNGPYGVHGINELLVKMRFDGRLPFNPLVKTGVPVMITRNTPSRRLFNGDVGVTVEGRSGIEVIFPRGDKVVSCPVGLLPEHELAYAMTVHKSQGSEFENVMVVLPDDKEHPLLNRQVVYTGITRAKKRAVIVGTGSALAAALSRRIERDTGVSLDHMVEPTNLHSSAQI